MRVRAFVWLVSNWRTRHRTKRGIGGGGDEWIAAVQHMDMLLDAVVVRWSPRPPPPPPPSIGMRTTDLRGGAIEATDTVRYRHVWRAFFRHRALPSPASSSRPPLSRLLLAPPPPPPLLCCWCGCVRGDNFKMSIMALANSSAYYSERGFGEGVVPV